jgi:putative transposase
MINKAYKIKLYPTVAQAKQIDLTINHCRFIYNKFLEDRITTYQEFKDRPELLKKIKYKTTKQLREEFPFLNEVSFNALDAKRLDVENAYKNFFRTKKGFPKFKSKHRSRLSYKHYNDNRIIDNKLTLTRVGRIVFRGLAEEYQGTLKQVTIVKNKDNTYEAILMVEREEIHKPRKSNNILGIDLGIKSFITCSNGEQIDITNTDNIERKVKQAQKHLSRKERGSNRYEKQRVKVARLHTKRTNIQKHFFDHLVNKLCSENQTIYLEDLNVKGMVKNRKLSRAISNQAWSKFVNTLTLKSREYDTKVVKIDRFYPSSKLCSKCGNIDKELKLSDRTYKCKCGLEIDRDLNAAINIKNFDIIKSSEIGDYRRGEKVRLFKLQFSNIDSKFCEASNTNTKVKV